MAPSTEDWLQKLRQEELLREVKRANDLKERELRNDPVRRAEHLALTAALLYLFWKLPTGLKLFFLTFAAILIAYVFATPLAREPATRPKVLPREEVLLHETGPQDVPEDFIEDNAQHDSAIAPPPSGVYVPPATSNEIPVIRRALDTQLPEFAARSGYSPKAIKRLGPWAYVVLVSTSGRGSAPVHAILQLERDRWMLKGYRQSNNYDDVVRLAEELAAPYELGNW